MNYVIVYWSRYGNGKKIVETIETKLKKNNADVQMFTTDEADPTKLPEAETYIFSAPTEAFRIKSDMRKFMKKLQGMEGKKYGIINTHSMNKNWLGSMEKTLSKKNMVKVAAIDFKVGKDPQSGNALPEGWEQPLDTFIKNLS